MSTTVDQDVLSTAKGWLVFKAIGNKFNYLSL